VKRLKAVSVQKLDHHLIQFVEKAFSSGQSPVAEKENHTGEAGHWLKDRETIARRQPIASPIWFWLPNSLPAILAGNAGQVSPSMT